ncbi:MAG: class I SAM-dependent RNA methyltransferase [Gemmatimonadales bacterium]|nr:class I SAM-dependent RNA methyltransferase [Gemmatimonadales bacterium]
MTTVRILRLATGGDGVGKLPDGKTVFVPRTAPGDLIELSELREHKRFARARLGRILEPSADRVDPRCPHYVNDQCGGCQIQHVAYELQLDSRRSFVGDALRRLGKRDVSDPPIVPAPKIFDYRTKVTLHVSQEGSRIGLHRYGRPDQVFDLEWCHITVPELMELWQAIRALRPYLPPHLAQVVLRSDRQGGRHVVLRVGAGEVWSGFDRLRRELDRRGIVATIWYQPEGGAARAVAGTAEAFPATVFEQVNPEMGDRVRSYAIEQLGEVAGRRVWDLYAGIGETTLQLAGRGAIVESVEVDRRAVAEAETRGPAARRLTGRVEDALRELHQPELVIANPPRVGMDQRVSAELSRLAPGRLVYISCDPATLARDLKRLERFHLTSVQAFDLFPQTTHVETVAVLEPV